MGERGGFGVVAVDGDDGPIVAEASYEPLPDGDGELAMAVSKRWRGWLGAYLLDTLIEAAAARGVPNLEADVLVVNGRMLSLLRSPGYATLPSRDWVSLRPHRQHGRPDAGMAGGRPAHAGRDAAARADRDPGRPLARHAAG